MPRLLAGLLLAMASFSALADPEFSVVRSDAKHTLTDKQLAALDGVVFWDKKAKAVLEPALKQLLGPKWNDYVKAFHTTSPMKYANGTLTGAGFWGPQSAAVELRPDGFMAAGFKDESGKCTDFGKVNPGYLCEQMD